MRLAKHMFVKIVKTHGSRSNRRLITYAVARRLGQVSRRFGHAERFVLITLLEAALVIRR